MSEKIIVSGVGCCLVDLLYSEVNFNSDAIRPYLSVQRGDGGLTPGHLVFREEFESYSRIPFDRFLKKITGGRGYDKINIGGPSIVSLINVSQLTDKDNCEVRFYGRGGNDDAGNYLISSLRKTSVVLKDYTMTGNQTPSTIVLSDPSFANGHGERMFINSIGAAWEYAPEDLDDDFFKSDIVVLGGTALVPHIHDGMTSLLSKAKSEGCITVVNTVFDFRNEKANPEKRWPLGRNDDTYKYIDLLITDQEEAYRLSGSKDLQSAIKFFLDNKVSSFMITNGSENISVYSDGNLFNSSDVIEMPVSEKVLAERKNVIGGDTTGCGDNFAGGVIASVVNQLQAGEIQPDLVEAVCNGVVSGGFTCFYLGGTYFEEKTGEKRAKMKPFYDAYKKQISG